MQITHTRRGRRAKATVTLFLTGLALTAVLVPGGMAGTTAGDVTRFSPDTGQPIFPVGNLNVFKQYVFAVDVSERIGDSVSIPLVGTFGGEISAGVKAVLGLEVGMCFGGNADFDLAFKPTITVPDRYPTEFPIRLVVDEGLRPDSHFTTTFPPLGKAYADLIFEMGANLGVEACVFGCVGFGFELDTCDPIIPSVGGFRMFKESVRCDPAIDDEAYCSVELASFNRGDDNTFRMLNVTANNRFEFMEKPYLEFAPSTGIGSSNTFDVLEVLNLLVISGINRLSDGTEVKVSSTGTLPGGLSSSRTYFVTQYASGPNGLEFQLATRKGGSGIDLTSVGTGVHTVTPVETNKPDAPTFGKYGTISINAPTVGTDSRVASSNGDEKPWTANPASDQILLLSPGGFRDGNKVRLSSVGKLPEGLSRGCTYYVTNVSGPSLQLATSYGGPPVDFQGTGTGTHRIALNAEFNTTGTLTSTGAEDMMSVDIDVATLVSDILLPPTFPSLSGSDSIGPLSFDYTLASLTLGPAVQLQTDFEMSWDLVVTDILFHQPNTLVPAPVIVEGVEITGGRYRTAFPAQVVHLTNSGPHPLPGIALINTDPVAVTIIYTLAPKLKTTVLAPFLGRVKYEALGAGASISRVGELRFGPLIKGEHVFKAGEFTVFDGDPSPIESTGPRSEYELNQDIARYDLLLVDTASDSVPTDGCALVVVYKVVSDLHIRIFDAIGEIAEDGPASSILSPTAFASLQDLLDPWPLGDLAESEGEKVLSNATRITGNQPGVIQLTLKAAGPPSFLYVPRIFQVREFRGVGTYWDEIDRSNVAEPFSNWIERILLLDDPNNPNADDSYPGELGVSSDATIDVTPGTELNKAKEIASLQIGQNGYLNIYEYADSVAGESASLTVNGGVVNNEGIIEISGTRNGAFMRLDSPNAVLSGSGNLFLTSGTSLKGEADSAEPITFSNTNTISGLGYAMDRYGIGAGITTTNIGAFTARGGSDDNGDDKLFTSADLFINHGTLSGEAGTLQVRGARLENRPAGSEGGGGVVRATSEQGSVFVQYNEVEQAGYFEASNGGYIGISPAGSDPALWNGGQGLSGWQPGTALPEGSGAFLATGTNSRINFFNTRMIGGFFAMSNGGTVSSTASSFEGTVFQVGDFNPTGVDPDSGKLIVQGTLTDVFLTNYGTVEISGDTLFVNAQLLANNGTVSVDAGRTFQIQEIIGRTEDPAAPEVAQRYPGTANATEELLVGGTWDIAGTLLIDGAAFKGIGANALRSRTTYGSRKDGDSSDPVLQIEDDLTGVLSLGNPAHVILRGTGASFPALNSLLENGGTLELREGADFPSSGPGENTVGNLINGGSIIVDQGSVLSVGGSYIQAGPDSSTLVLNGAQLVSATQDYQIIGGSLTAEDGASLLGLSGSGFLAGTSLRVESPLIDTNEIDPFTGLDISVQERVRITLGSAVSITNISTGADVTIHGGAVDFPALTGNQLDIFGSFTVSGDGYENPGDLSFGFIANLGGTVNITGRGTSMEAALYVQENFDSSTRIGSGARLVSPDINIVDGELVVEISARPREEQFGQIQSPRLNFNDRLVIDFVGEVAASSPDIGDTWPIIKAESNSRMEGLATVQFRHENGPIPSDWLPVGSHLEVIRLNPREVTDGDTISGLGIQVVPDGGFVEYDDWAVARGLDRSPSAFLSDPMQDIDEDGVANVYDFLFGNNDGSGIFPGRQSSRLIEAAEGGAYYELSYDRPIGTGAAFNPYVSEDLITWYPAAMIITDIVNLGNGSNQQRVFLESTFPLPDSPVFLRIDGSLNKIDHGLVGEKPINFFGGASMNNLTPEDLIQDNLIPGYLVVPGRELFFRTTGHGEGSIRAYVTSGVPGGEGLGEYLYGGFSALGRAAVFQGLLAVGETGLLKVTFVEVPPVPDPDFSFTTWIENGVTANGFGASDYSQPYSFTIERLTGYAD